MLDGNGERDFDRGLMKKAILVLVMLTLILGCVDNRDPRYNKTYFSMRPSNYFGEKNYQAYVDGAPSVKISKPKETSVKIASWNLQRYGPTKGSKPELVAYYTSKLKIYDIAIVQELTDSKGAAIKNLTRMMKNHKFFLSKPVGTTEYKEQYGVFYNNKTVLLNTTYINVTGIARIPLRMDFRSGNWSFVLITLHTSPNSVYEELEALEKNISNINQDTVIIGDLNAGCEYYTTKTSFLNWIWEIPDFEDTTSGETSCPYDRIIVNHMAEGNYRSYEIMRDVNSLQSDHYLIAGTFDTTNQ